MVDQGGGSKATERTLSVLPLEKTGSAGDGPRGDRICVPADRLGRPLRVQSIRAQLRLWRVAGDVPSGTVRTLEEYSLDGPIFNSIAAGGYLELHRGCFVQAAVAPDAIPSGSAAPAARALADALLPGAHE